MQLILIAHRGCTTLKIRYVCIVVGNNQSTLKLTCISCIDAEIRAKLHRTANAVGDIYKRAITKHS